MRFTCNSIAIRLPHIINDSPLHVRSIIMPKKAREKGFHSNRPLLKLSKKLFSLKNKNRYKKRVRLSSKRPFILALQYPPFFFNLSTCIVLLESHG
jgi:hypothetical protein